MLGMIDGLQGMSAFLFGCLVRVCFGNLIHNYPLGQFGVLPEWFLSYFIAICKSLF